MDCSQKTTSKSMNTQNISTLNNMINELFLYNSKLSMNYDNDLQKRADELKKDIDKLYDKIFKTQ